MSYYYDKILQESKVAYAIFDSNFFLKHYSRNLSNIIQLNNLNSMKCLWDIFPELFGSEEEIEAILKFKSKRYQLVKINKYTSRNDLIYYDLTLLPITNNEKSTTDLLCIISDTTAETSLEQEIRQQKFEIELLKASLLSYGNYSCENILGNSTKVKNVCKFINKISYIKNTTILLQGESGTGKNLVARVIHQLSMMPDSPFVEINCASIPSTLLESEIFGYEKGAFTNAISSKNGLIEVANNGTLFLDEIGELPHPLQAKLLSFMESKTFRRLGSTKEKKVELRIIAATNKDLSRAVENSEFRQDLYYRLNVVNLKLPPLRELGDDIIMIAEHFIKLFALNFHKNIKDLAEDAKIKLQEYSWPGNVRELRNVIERAVIFAEKDKISSHDIILVEDKTHSTLSSFNIPDKGISLVEIEKKLLLEAIAKTSGNQSHAARLLGLSLDTFRYRVKKYNLSTPITPPTIE